MRRVVHKMRPNRWGMLVGPILIAAPYFAFVLFSSGIEWEYATGIVSILWIGFVYFIRFALALLLVSFAIMYMLRVHRGVSTVSYLTYVDNVLFSKFNRISADFDPNERIFWDAQRNIALRKGTGDLVRPVAEKGIISSPESKSENAASHGNHVTDAEMSVDSILNRPESADTEPDADPLAELPEYDPNGPNPFA